jgi:hypothetical protein
MSRSEDRIRVCLDMIEHYSRKKDERIVDYYLEVLKEVYRSKYAKQ